MLNNIILKIAYLIVILAVLATLIFFLMVQFKAGVETGFDKLLTAMYFILIGWALYRAYTLVRAVFRK